MEWLERELCWWTLFNRSFLERKGPPLWLKEPWLWLASSLKSVDASLGAGWRITLKRTTKMKTDQRTMWEKCTTLMERGPPRPHLSSFGISEMDSIMNYRRLQPDTCSKIKAGEAAALVSFTTVSTKRFVCERRGDNIYQLTFYASPAFCHRWQWALCWPIAFQGLLQPIKKLERELHHQWEVDEVKEV